MRTRFYTALALVLTLVVSACAKTPAPPATTTAPTTTSAPAPTTTAPSTTTKPAVTTTAPPSSTGSGKPVYGGNLLRVLPSDPTSWGPFPGTGATPQQLEELWDGDWTAGNAGGYGQKLTDWAHTVDRFDRKAGLIAEKTTWTVDAATNKAKIVYTIRQGIHYQKIPNSAASALVNGRELTADDIVFCMQQRITDTTSYVYLSNPELRNAVITKTGPWEVTNVVDAAAMLTALNRFSGTSGYYPPEVFQQFKKMADWKDQVGTGALALTNYVAGSAVTYTKNPDYWQKDPIGPGKGNQLPYIDSMTNLIITDIATRISALRTGKVDTLTSVLASDALPLISGSTAVPGLKSLEKTSVDGRGTPVFLRIDLKPFDDVRVRQAMMLSIDFNSILKDYWGGKGQIMTYPFADTADYHDLFLGLNDPDTPPVVKDLFTYNPEKAKKLLADAGFPNGFNTSIMLNSAAPADADYYTIIKGMWQKIGINLSLDIKDQSAFTSLQAARTYQMIPFTTAPAATFYLGVSYQGTGQISNQGNLNDPVVNKALLDVNKAALTDLPQAMKIWRNDLAKYVLSQAYAIPNVIGYNYNIWWPWLANYSGEGPVAYAQTTWPKYVWIDQALKKSMGK
jgi:peptide/nickel transport system substrate-binding protein